MNRTLSLLALLFVLLMSLPWLVPHMGWLALFGLVPLLCMDRIASLSGVKHFFLWYYLSFVAWNALTTFWVCNATLGGGIFAVLANAFQMAAVFAVFRLSKKHLKGVLPYILLSVLWVSWERFYLTSAQISWPWLVLGNAFARTTSLVQWYEYTGALGGSLWIWSVNLAVFGMMAVLSDGRFSSWNVKARAASITALLGVLVLPIVASVNIGARYEERNDAGQMEVLIGQPNFDPYHKFESMSQAQQTAALLNLYSPELEGRDSSSSSLLLVAPETFTSDIVLNDLQLSRTWRTFKNYLEKYPNTDILFGASTYDLYNQKSKPSILARKYGSGWMESHNSALLMDMTGRTDVFHKSKLVVGTELTPYPKLFVKLDDMLGGVMGRCKGQEGISLLSTSDGISLGCAVCYESVYGEYCTGYERLGAKALAVITNDAWWGDTPGYKQHLSYSALRAIELRRDIFRCANTGISAIIDQKGNIISQTEWWSPAVLSSSVNLSSEMTFFALHGDMVGRICVLAAALLALALLASVVKTKTT